MWRVTVTKHPPLDATLVRAIASALTDTEGGLSNTGIDEVFSVLGQSSPSHGTKRYRVSEALLESSNVEASATSSWLSSPMP
jgi:hypothetical protein